MQDAADAGDHQVAVLNRSTVVEDGEVETIVKALQVQVDRDFEPAWGVGAQLDFLPKGEMTGWQGKWNLVVLDTSDEANALGYHDMTPEGLPLGKCFAKSDQIAGSALSVTMSHELLEMLADPSINLTALDQSDATHGRLYAYESCDACEADQYAYEIDSIPVSDFVFPTWFDPTARDRGETKFDQQGQIKQPFELLPGGYIGMMDLTSPQGWQQITAEGEPDDDPLQRPRVGSRRERRRTPLSAWKSSKS
jgi:hypothetical protein